MSNWILPSEALPEPGQGVIIHTPDAAEEVWFGFHDGLRWCELDGHPIDGPVMKWMERPSAHEPQPETEANGL